MDIFSIDLKPYLDTIALLEKRRNDLLRLQKLSHFTFSVNDRLKCIVDELYDLYDIVSYLRSSRKEIFLDK